MRKDGQQNEEEEEELAVDPSFVLQCIIRVLEESKRTTAITSNNDDDYLELLLQQHEQEAIESCSFLWDLSVTEAHTAFMQKHGVPSVLLNLLARHSLHSDRLIELAVGTLANMTSFSSVASSLAARQDMQDVLWQLWLDSFSVPVLIELSRFFTVGVCTQQSQRTWLCCFGRQIAAATTTENKEEDEEEEEEGGEAMLTVKKEERLPAIDKLVWVLQNTLDETLLEKASDLIYAIIAYCKEAVTEENEEEDATTSSDCYPMIISYLLHTSAPTNITELVVELLLQQLSPSHEDNPRDSLIATLLHTLELCLSEQDIASASSSSFDHQTYEKIVKTLVRCISVYSRDIADNEAVLHSCVVLLIQLTASQPSFLSFLVSGALILFSPCILCFLISSFSSCSSSFSADEKAMKALQTFRTLSDTTSSSSSVVALLLERAFSSSH
ncbi:hypothetical protein QOT17_015412 [Balamuthia mandrillaris]